MKERRPHVHQFNQESSLKRRSNVPLVDDLLLGLCVFVIYFLSVSYMTLVTSLFFTHFLKLDEMSELAASRESVQRKGSDQGCFPTAQLSVHKYHNHTSS